MAEAIERHSAISDGTEARLHTSYKDLGDQALDPRTLTQFSQDQYEQRDVLNQVKDPYHWVPEKFDPTAEIDWMPVWRPACDETAWIPAAYSLFMFDHGAMLPGAKMSAWTENDAFRFKRSRKWFYPRRCRRAGSA